jgi:hypothetical protein
VTTGCCSTIFAATRTPRLNCTTSGWRSNEQLGNLDGIAAANWSLALISLSKDDPESALARTATAFQIFHQLRRADGIAVVGQALAATLANVDLLLLSSRRSN